MGGGAGRTANGYYETIKNIYHFFFLYVLIYFFLGIVFLFNNFVAPPRQNWFSSTFSLLFFQLFANSGTSDIVFGVSLERLFFAQLSLAQKCLPLVFAPIIRSNHLFAKYAILSSSHGVVIPSRTVNTLVFFRSSGSSSLRCRCCSSSRCTRSPFVSCYFRYVGSCPKWTAPHWLASLVRSFTKFSLVNCTL